MDLGVEAQSGPVASALPEPGVSQEDMLWSRVLSGDLGGPRCSAVTLGAAGVSLSRSGPQMIQTHGRGFLQEGKQEKSTPCQLQNSLKIESHPRLQDPDAIPQITQFQLHYYQLTTRQSFPATLGEISHCP